MTQTQAGAPSLKEAAAGLEALHETALAILSVQDLGSVLGLILKEVQRLTRADRARIAILEPEGNSFAIRADADDPAEQTPAPASYSPSALTRQIIKEGRPRFVEDVDRDKAQRSSRMTDRTRAYVGVPLVNRDRSVGVLYVEYNQRQTFAPARRRLVRTLASLAALAITNAQMFEEIRLAAITDSLTGLPNHRVLMDRLEEEIARACRSGHPLAVMMIDIDDFKLINDAHGHTTGDEVLRLVARTLQGTLRSTDLLGRYGGDEFLALLPETDRAGAHEVAERALSAIRSLQFRVRAHDGSLRGNGESSRAALVGSRAAGTAIPLHLSMGVAICPLDSAVGLELISLADAAMYAAKMAGGATVTFAHATDRTFLAAQNPTFSALEGLVNAVNNKDHYTRLHSEQVTQYALILADAIGLDAKSKRLLRIASLLHDIGKVGIPDRVLRKPGPLDEEERGVMQQHPLLGEMIIREVPQLSEVLEAVRHHHERFDGTGYPRGLADDEIPLLSRVMAVADAFSAMVLDRPYRRALAVEEAMQELEICGGTQLDPELVEAFVRTLQVGAKGAGSPTTLAAG